MSDDGDSPVDAYADDFDAGLADEFDIGPGGSASPADYDPDLRAVYASEHSKASALLEAKLSAFEGELARKLDETMITRRPGTGAMRMSIDVSQSVNFAAPRQSPSPRGLPSSSSVATLPVPSVEGASVASGSARSMRQSQDLFAALDLAHTEETPGLKASYSAYWDAVEEQFRAEQRADQELRDRRTRDAESKHVLTRLKAKMAAQREASAGAGGAQPSAALTKAEAGWDDGWSYNREVVHARSPKAARHAPPSVVKASKALANFMSDTTNTPTNAMTTQQPFASSLVQGGGAGGRKSERVPQPQSSPTASGGPGGNAKPLPPPPGGIVDPSRIRRVVQTHMPAIVLARLAASRRAAKLAARTPQAAAQLALTAQQAIQAAKEKRQHTQQQQQQQLPQRPGRSAPPTRTVIGGSGGAAAGSVPRKGSFGADVEDEVAEEISPVSRASSTAKSRASMGGTSVGPPSRGVSAKPTRSTSGDSAAAAAAAQQQPPARSSPPAARASSAGMVKPTNASALLAAERAAQAQAAAIPADSKVVPIAQWNRMRREVEELRRKCVALEVENEQLRKVAATAEPPAKPAAASTPSPIEGTKPPRATSATQKPSLSRTGSTVSTSSGPTSGGAPPRIGAPVLSKMGSSTSSAGSTSSGVPTPTFKHPAAGQGLKLNLAGLSPDGESAAPTPVQQQQAAAALLSPRSKCAVNQCGQPRMSGKPYCAAHLTSHPPTPTAATGAAAAASAAATFVSPKFKSSGSSSSSDLSASPSPPAAAAAAASSATRGFTLGLGGSTVKYDYDYESDDNYGGTDVEEDESFDDTRASLDDTGGGRARQRPAGDDDDDDDEDAAAGASANYAASASGTARMMGSVRSSPPKHHQAALEVDEYEDEEYASFGAHGGDTARQVMGNTARMSGTGTARQVTTQPASSSRVAATGAFPSSGRPSPASSAAPSARQPLNAPSSSVTPRTTHSTSRQGDVPSISLGLGGGVGGLDLESLRSSPYAGIDGFGALNGSFEITQSGTFKRGGFALNKQGMSSTPTSASGAGGGNSGITSASRNRSASDSDRAFQWEPPVTGRVGTAAGVGGGTDRSMVGSAAGGGTSFRSSPASSTASTPSSASQSSMSVGSNASPSASAGASATMSGGIRSLNPADLYMLGVLGRGSGGVVYRAFHAPSMELMAVKEIGIHEKDKRKQLTQELRTLTLPPSPYTIGFRGAYFDDQHIYIALEYMDGGSLDDLRESMGQVPERELAFIAEQCLRGLVHLERLGTIHRDIKPHNILYSCVGARFVLSDFGIVSEIKERTEAENQAKTFVGTLLYMSPERIEGQPYSYACDIWSLALSLLSCRVGDFAIPYSSHWDLVKTIKTGPAILNHYSREQVSDHFRDLLAHCLRVNPLERPTASECLRHPFFNQYRTNGSSQPIPRPANFPPPRMKPAVAPTGSPFDGNVDGASGSREERRSRRELEVERKNELHMLEQVCKLIASKGMTVRSNTTSRTSAGSPSTSPPLPLPIDPKLCERITERIVSQLKVSPQVTRTCLMQAHNKHVGYVEE